MHNNKSIGLKIRVLREKVNCSQEKLANFLGLKREIITNIENGNRKIKLSEIQKIAEFFDLTESDIINGEKKESISDALTVDDENYIIKNLILYFAEILNNKANFGETLLNKLLYFADFDFYEWNGELITGKKYYKLPYGPVPENIKEILIEMKKQGLIEIKETEFYGKRQNKIIPLTNSHKGFLKQIKNEEGCASAEEVVNNVIDKYGSWTASSLSERSHNDMPYKATKKISEEISPGLVFYRNKAYIVNPNNLDDDE